MECIAKIRAGNPRNASKIGTTSHRKWDKTNNQKIQKLIFSIKDILNAKVKKQMTARRFLTYLVKI